MRRLFAFILIICSLLTCFANKHVTIPQHKDDLQNLEHKIFVLINEYRASKGLSKLILRASIALQAKIHSKNMADGDVPFSHQGFEQRLAGISKNLPFIAAAENVSTNQGYSDPATMAVQGWLKSRGHKANIEGDYNLTGIGAAKTKNGKYFFTQIFVKIAK